jgi:hypothetical protein
MNAFKSRLLVLQNIIQKMKRNLNNGCNKSEFVINIIQIENECAQMRADIIYRSRAWHAGIRKKSKKSGQTFRSSK